MRSLVTSAASGEPSSPTSLCRSDARSPSSASMETSTAWLLRRYESIAALRAIW